MLRLLLFVRTSKCLLKLSVTRKELSVTEMRKKKKPPKVLCVISNACNKYFEDRRHPIRKVQKVIY